MTCPACDTPRQSFCAQLKYSSSCGTCSTSVSLLAPQRCGCPPGGALPLLLSELIGHPCTALGSPSISLGPPKLSFHGSNQYACKVSVNQRICT